ncbi:MAG: 4Fe-4S binding protein [Bacteroidales bacterium]|nr:4Fe-4S binding protein [Bacteroidales bacterium]
MKIHAIYFSPTGGTKKVVTEIAKGFCDGYGSREEMSESRIQVHDFTLPSGREAIPDIGCGDIAVIGTPVYAGRVPNLLLKYIESLAGNGALTVPVVTYGNRNFDDALIELRDLLVGCNFKPIAAAAFVAQHSFSNTLGAGRPDYEDLSQAYDMGRRLCGKLLQTGIGIPYVSAIDAGDILLVEVPGNSGDSRVYYQPKDNGGNFIDIRRVKPKTLEKCFDCGHCAEICPMGAISFVDYKSITGICIKCNACIKECKAGAKYFDDEGYLFHKEDLEKRYQSVKKNLIIVP